MIEVKVLKQSRYPVSSTKIKRSLKDFFKKQGIVSKAEVSVAIVGEKSMKNLGKKYLHEKGESVHNVLSFTSSETKGNFKEPPDGVIHLGEIILCYPVLVKEAQMEGKLIDEKAIELVCHGGLHLLGVHHA